MRYCTYLLSVVTLLIASPLFTWSQDATTARVTITSNVPQARVFIDSLEIGTTPLVGYAVTPGKHSVCVVSSDDRRWIASLACEQIDAEEGKEYQLHISLPRQIRITSEPYGARVIYGDTVRGETPYILLTREHVGSLRLSKEGYDETTMIFDGSTTLLHGVLNSPASGGLAPLGLAPLGLARNENTWLYLEKEESQTIAPVVITASSAVLTGVVAAYWKLRADNLYSDYRSTGNPAQLDQIRRLDVASGIAFGMSQVSLALLTYFLLSQ